MDVPRRRVQKKSSFGQQTVIGDLSRATPPINKRIVGGYLL